MPLNKSDYNILSTLLTAVIAGGGTGLLVNSLSDLIDLKRKKDLEKKITQRVLGTKVDVSKDGLLEKLKLDPTVTGSTDVVKVAGEKKDKNSDFYDTMMSILGAAVGGIGSYYATNKLYKWLKQKSLESEEDDLKEDYYKQLYTLKELKDEDIVKGKTTKYAGWAGSIIGGVAGLSLLGGLASAILSREILKDKYPKLDAKSAYKEALKAIPQPTVRYETKDDKEAEEYGLSEKELELRKKIKDNLSKELKEALMEDDEIKLACVIPSLLKDEVNENIIKLAYYSENENDDNLGIQAVIHSIANGNSETLKKANSLEDLFTIADSCSKYKFASADKTRLNLAFIDAANDPMLKELVVPASAIQVLHSYPLQNKLASAFDGLVDNEMKSDLSLICTMMNIDSRSKAFAGIRKEAAEKLKSSNEFNNVLKSDYDAGISTYEAIHQYLLNQNA